MAQPTGRPKRMQKMGTPMPTPAQRVSAATKPTTAQIGGTLRDRFTVKPTGGKLFGR